MKPYFASAQQLVRPVGDDLVDVHICGRTCTSLKDVHDEVLGELVRHDLLASEADSIGFLFWQKVQFFVGTSGR